MKTTLLIASLLIPVPVLGQTMYKCPSPTPGAPPIYQQMPCSPTGGGDQIKIAPSKPSRDESAEATARMKTYLDALHEERKQKQETGQVDKKSQALSLDEQIEQLRAEERAKQCYALEKRIHYIQRLEKKGAHVRYGSMGDEDSRAAIEQYKRQCGSWN